MFGHAPSCLALASAGSASGRDNLRHIMGHNLSKASPPHKWERADGNATYDIRFAHNSNISVSNRFAQDAKHNALDEAFDG